MALSDRVGSQVARITPAPLARFLREARGRFPGAAPAIWPRSSLSGIAICFSLGSHMRWFSKSDVRIVSAILAISILLGNIPFSAGIVVISYPKQPTFTLNVCEPLQTGLTSSMTFIARPATTPPRLVLIEDGKVRTNPLNPFDDLSIAPESPPPKAVV